MKEKITIAESFKLILVEKSNTTCSIKQKSAKNKKKLKGDFKLFH